MSIVDVEAATILDDPRFGMTEMSLDGAFDASAVSCPGASAGSVSEK
jgi:hypothetical protein